MIELKSTGVSAGTISSPALNNTVCETDLISRFCSSSGSGSGQANRSRKRCIPHDPDALLCREENGTGRAMFRRHGPRKLSRGSRVQVDAVHEFNVEMSGKMPRYSFHIENGFAED